MKTMMQFVSHFKRIPFVRDVATIQIGSMILMAAGFLSSIAFARFLGKDVYGQYAVILAFSGTFTAFFNIGQGQSLYVFFSEAFGKRDRRSMAAVIANFVAVAAANVVLLFLLALLMPVLSLQFYGSAEIGKAARILCFFQMSEILNSMTLIILQSIRNIRIKVILEQSANLSYLGLAIVVLFFGGRIHAVLLTQLAVSLFFLPVSIVTLGIIAKRFALPGIREVLRIPWSESKEYLGQGLLITADKTIGNFFPQGLFFFLSLFVPASFVGIARIAVQLANVPKSILLPQAGDLSTAAFAKMKTEGATVMRRNAAKLIKHALFFHTLLTMGAVVVFPPIVALFYGAEYLEAIPVMLWLLLIHVLSSLFIANSPLLRLYRKIHWSILAGIVNWTLMIGSLFILIRILPPLPVFLLTYLIGTTTPILLTWYVFSLLIPKSDILHPSA